MEPAFRPIRVITMNGLAGFTNPKIVTIFHLCAYDAATSKSHVAAMKYGTMYQDNPALFGKYGFSTGHLLHNECFCGSLRCGDKTYGGCVERKAKEDLRIDVYGLRSASSGIRILRDDLAKGIPSRISYRFGEDPCISMTFVLFISCDGLPAIGHPKELPYCGVQVGFRETDIKYKVERADWIPLLDVISGNVQFVGDYSELSLAMFEKQHK